MGIKIMTDEKSVKVWRSDKYDKPRYSIAIGKKEGDFWINHFQPVRFKQGIEVQNGQEIFIQHAFPVVDSWVKDDKQLTKETWVIMDFTYADGKMPEPVAQTEEQLDIGAFSSVDEDVPF